MQVKSAPMSSATPGDYDFGAHGGWPRAGLTRRERAPPALDRALLPLLALLAVVLIYMSGAWCWSRLRWTNRSYRGC